MESVKVSVIIPVYDPGDGIRKCIHSLRRQTLQEIEIIFVDDCGTDNSMDVIREAAYGDPRICILKNPENMGSGPSRNRGIEAARGKYLSFVDADDFVSEDFLELLYRKAEASGADIVKGRRVLIWEDGTPVEETDTKLNERICEGLKSGTPLLMLFRYEHQSAIYRRDWVFASGARYGSSLNAQDTTFLLEVTYGTDKITFADEAKYFYVARNDSRTKDFSERRLKSQMLALREKIDYLTNKEGYSTVLVCYVSIKLTYYLSIQASAVIRCESSDVADVFFSDIYELAEGLPYVDQIAEQNLIMEAFIYHKVNLSLEPYDEKWGHVQFDEYLNAVHRVVDFLCNHPDLTARYKYFLWQAFGNAIRYKETDSNTRKYKKEKRLKLRTDADRLPDSSVLTLPIRLYIYYGIDTYTFQQTLIGKQLKILLARWRDKSMNT